MYIMCSIMRMSSLFVEECRSRQGFVMRMRSGVQFVCESGGRIKNLKGLCHWTCAGCDGRVWCTCNAYFLVYQRWEADWQDCWCKQGRAGQKSATFCFTKPIVGPWSCVRMWNIMQLNWFRVESERMVVFWRVERVSEYNFISESCVPFWSITSRLQKLHTINLICVH